MKKVIIKLILIMTFTEIFFFLKSNKKGCVDCSVFGTFCIAKELKIMKVRGRKTKTLDGN